MGLRGEGEIAADLAVLSTAEIVAALGATGLSPLLRAVVEGAARVPSRRLGRALGRFDALIAAVGITRAARATLAAFGVALEVEGAARSRGPLLVVTNHPGAYDALALLTALQRDDVALVAADRAFLRAMPSLSTHLVFVDEGRAFGRLAGLRGALAWLASGRALVQFGAGAIEPDARFADGVELVAPWAPGTGVLAAGAAKLDASIVPAFVSGVHSSRAKRLPLVRWAERRGITTIAPLIQATVPGFRDVAVSVRIGAPIERASLDGLTHVEAAMFLRAAVGTLGGR